MKKIIMVSACLALAACGHNAAPDAAAASKDEAAIKQVLKDITLANSPAKMAAAFVEDGEWIVVGHTPYKGRAEIEKGIAAFTTPGNKIVFDSLDVKEVILFNDHQALAKSVAVYHVDANGKAGPSKRNEFADYLVKSADGTWQIAYEINSDDNG
mgnify:CR=1 FL=1